MSASDFFESIVLRAVAMALQAGAWALLRSLGLESISEVRMERHATLMPCLAVASASGWTSFSLGTRSGITCGLVQRG